MPFWRQLASLFWPDWVQSVRTMLPDGDLPETMPAVEELEEVETFDQKLLYLD
jgi:hypothetical protein